ncbi:MAG: hypothetical protein V1877_00970 [Candidatus Tagabacteria bacterium]
MPKLPTNALMESFEEYSKAIRKTKPNFTRFKDGNLIKNALRHISKFQVEMLFLWFLKEKIHMQPTIGAALSKGIITDFIKASRKEYGFYNKLDQLARRYANIKKGDEEMKTEAGEMIKALEKLRADFSKKVKPFSYRERARIAEEISAQERKNE